MIFDISGDFNYIEVDKFFEFLNFSISCYDLFSQFFNCQYYYLMLITSFINMTMRKSSSKENFLIGRSRFLSRRFWWTSHIEYRWKKNSHRLSILGNRMRTWTFTRSIHKHPEVHTLDRQDTELRMNSTSFQVPMWFFVSEIREIRTINGARDSVMMKNCWRWAIFILIYMFIQLQSRIFPIVHHIFDGNKY